MKFVPGPQDHRTPESVLEIVRAYAPIGLDPCSNPLSTVNARVSFALHNGEDGLAECWKAYLDAPDDIVFVNCPYAKILPWVEKCWAESAMGVESLLLVPCSPETKWSKLARQTCTARGAWRTRIAFIGAGGNGAKQPSALYHFGPNYYRFAHHFEPHLCDLSIRPNREAA
jgi:hypothetical protein